LVIIVPLRGYDEPEVSLIQTPQLVRVSLTGNTLSPGTLELLSPGNRNYGGNFSRMILKDGLENTQTDYLAASQAIAILENRAGKLPEGGTNKRRIKPNAPFFLAVGFVRPHVPFIAPRSSFDQYPENDMNIPKVVVGENIPKEALRRQNDKVWKMDETQKKQTIGAYMASVQFMDQQVGRLLDTLDRLKIREETIVIFISDHGYNLGEHDSWSKASLWEGSIRVPMIISHPGYKETHGTTDNTITELIDLYPTLVDLGNFDEEQPKILQGKSLAGILKGEEIGESSVAYTISFGGNGASVRTDKWRYTRWGADANVDNEEFYNHSNDPEEHINLSDDQRLGKELIEIREIFESAREKAEGV
jgi:arylsulfatase A-like enzyme